VIAGLKDSRRRRLAIVTGIAIVLVVLAAFAAPDPLRSLLSLRRVDEYPLYVMHLYGSYGFEDFLKRGIRADSSVSPDRQEPAWACTVLAAVAPEGSPLLGRNFDWPDRPVLLLFAHPPDGYASVSLVHNWQPGFYSGESSWLARLQMLDAAYSPFDGMNEAGLAVGMMAVPSAQTSDDPDKVTIGSLHAIRLLLDNASSVDQAIALLQAYNIDWEGGPPLHYLVADRSGDSAVIEFLDGELVVVRSDHRWLVSTNFLLKDRDQEAARALCQRYARASDALQRVEGKLAPGEVMSLLEEVSQRNTVWSVVYNTGDGRISVALGRKYDEVHKFELPMGTLK
jgi:hypothetical protein